MILLLPYIAKYAHPRSVVQYLQFYFFFFCFFFLHYVVNNTIFINSNLVHFNELTKYFISWSSSAFTDSQAWNISNPNFERYNHQSFTKSSVGEDYRHPE